MAKNSGGGSSETPILMMMSLQCECGGLNVDQLQINFNLNRLGEFKTQFDHFLYVPNNRRGGFVLPGELSTDVLHYIMLI